MHQEKPKPGKVLEHCFHGGLLTQSEWFQASKMHASRCYSQVNLMPPEDPDESLTSDHAPHGEPQ